MVRRPLLEPTCTIHPASSMEAQFTFSVKMMTHAMTSATRVLVCVELRTAPRVQMETYAMAMNSVRQECVRQGPL